jgi:predicted Ser/Thr protein kinase
VLSERDALLLELALERHLIDAEAYGGLLEELEREAEVGAARLLRARGVPGKEVGLLVELATPAAGDPRAILSRADAEQVLVVESLRKAGLVPEPQLRAAEARVRAEALRGRFLAVTEVLVDTGALELPRAVALRRRARELLATCPGCWRHYLLPGRRRARCGPCGRTIEAGVGRSAVDAWRVLPGEEPAAGEATRKFAVTLSTPRPPVARPERASGDASATAFDESAEAEEGAPDPASATVSDAEEASEEGPPTTGAAPPAAQVDALLADWEASVAIAEEGLAGERTSSFGGYELLGELARGGMGVVYRGRRRATGEEVALKVLLGGVHASARQGARFEREAELARRLSHPGVVGFVEAGIEEGFRYMAVELVPGRDLEETVRREGPLPWDEATRVVAELADALDYVHGQGVIHRDLKPDNVILRPDGRPVLIDFGLARILDARQLTESQSAIGTPAYMPPEQVTGKSREAGPPADVYALGAMLHFLIAGRPPFDEEDQAVLYHQIVTAAPPPLRRVVPGVPAALEAAVLAALAKDPQRRPPTAAALAERLRAALDPSAAPAPRLPLLLLLLAALAAVSLAAWLLASC